jgi:hypothetical protein
MELVTVTCDRDFNQMVLQSHSINRFVISGMPIVHWVIIESSNKSMQEWKDVLSPFYQRHNLKLILGSSLIKVDEKIYGYFRQQMLKLLIANLVDDDTYLVLDSKNVFVRHCSLDTWPIEEGNNYRDRRDLLILYKSYIDYLENLFGWCPTNFWHPITPFLMKKEVVKLILDKINVYEILDTSKINHRVSEFVLYKFFAKEDESMPRVKEFDHCLWGETSQVPNPAEWINYLVSDRAITLNLENVVILSFNRKYMIKQPDVFLKIAKSLSQNGLDFSILVKALVDRGK